jgi:peptidoglycan/LPS O-acetylase OafA/YrhL
MKHISFRFDIDGLRAVALLSILIFHINEELIPGGFVGVDIFFAISGYLITGIITKRNLVENQYIINIRYCCYSLPK